MSTLVTSISSDFKVLISWSQPDDNSASITAYKILI